MNVDTDVVRVALERRSTRDFVRDRSVDGSVLKVIVRCGLAAPSSKNSRPARFHVVVGSPMLAALAEAVETAEDGPTYVPHDPRSSRPRPEYESTVLESAEVLRTCAAGIFVENVGPFSSGRTTLLEVPRPSLAASIVGYGLEMIGIGAAVENMLLAAHSFGLGATFMGDVMVGESAISEALGLTGDLMGVVALGHPAEQSPPRQRDADLVDPSIVVWH